MFPVLLIGDFCARREDFSLTVLRVRHIESPSPPRFFAGEKVPKADEGAALGRSSLRKRPSPALRVSLSPQEDAGRGTLDRKHAWWVAGDSQRCVPSLSCAVPSLRDSRLRRLWMTNRGAAG